MQISGWTEGRHNWSKQEYERVLANWHCPHHPSVDSAEHWWKQILLEGYDDWNKC